MTPELVWENDLCLSLRLEPDMSLSTALMIHAMDAAVAAADLPYVRARIPSYCTLMLHLSPSAPPMSRTERDLREAIGNIGKEEGSPELDCMTIPVCYSPAFGPDMETVMSQTGMDRTDIIRLHTDRSLYVCMLGFLAGFPYLLGMNEKLACPRKTRPALQIPAGSVGIAGKQTGIYPVNSPGGWQIIGRTPLTLFSPDRSPAALLKSGMAVRFREIDNNEYRAIQSLGPAYVPTVVREVLTCWN